MKRFRHLRVADSANVRERVEELADSDELEALREQIDVDRTE
jgi:hypothetical protein